MKRPAPLQKTAHVLASLASTAVVLSAATAATADFEPPPGTSAPERGNSTTVSRLYTPPADSTAPRPGTTGTNISRGGGCSSASIAGLVPFAPQTHIGQTTSVDPTFTWFTPETGAQIIEFRIAEYLPERGFRVVYDAELETADLDPSGITTLPLSEADFSLSPDTTYRWQVVLVCNPNRPSESLVAEADIAVVDSSADLETVLAGATTMSDRARLYAEAGLWYDALGAVVASETTDSQQTQLILLEDLAITEAQGESADEDGSYGTIHSDRLQQVIEGLQ